MKKITLKFELKQAEDIAPFFWNGLPHLHFHYWLQNENGSFDWRWVEPSTDFEWLQEKINEGLIFIHE